MDTRTGEIKRLEEVSQAELDEHYVELKDEEVVPLANLPMAERPAALAEMRGVDLDVLSPKQKKDKARRRQAEKRARKSRARNRR